MFLLWLPVQAGTIDDVAGQPNVIQVGPDRAIKTIAAAAKMAGPSAVIEVDSGIYEGDVAVWTQDALTLRAVGGRVKLIANGAAAEGKGIWVMSVARWMWKALNSPVPPCPTTTALEFDLKRARLPCATAPF